MTLEAVMREFNVRYYQWALHDFRREIEQDFPYLKCFKSGGPRVVVDMMSRLDFSDQLHFAAGLVKRFHADAVDTLGESMTPCEKEFCEEYLALLCRPAAHELALLQRAARGELRVYANRGKLKRLVRVEFQSAGLQMFEPEARLGELTYVQTVDTWQVFTRVSTSDRNAQLSYHHDIWSAEKVKDVVLPDGTEDLWPLQLKSLVSLTSWLGITSQTQWADLVEADGPPTAHTLVALCKHFLNAAPRLLSGLSPD